MTIKKIKKIKKTRQDQTTRNEKIIQQKAHYKIKDKICSSFNLFNKNNF